MLTFEVCLKLYYHIQYKKNEDKYKHTVQTMTINASVAEPPLFWAAPAPAPAPGGQGPGADSDSGSDLLGSAPAPAPAPAPG